MKPESLKALGAAELSRAHRVALGLDDGAPEAGGLLEEYRRALPLAVGKMTELVVDNPGQFVILAAGTVVLTKTALNIVRPRTAVQALALAVVLQAGIPVLGMQAVRRGWLRFRVRDDHGCLVPLERPDDDPGPDPA